MQQMETQEQESCERQNRNGNRRVILFPLPFQGHVNPMLQLGSILYSKGISITIIHTKFNSPNPSNFPDFEFHSISDGISEAQASSEDATSTLTTLYDTCVLPFRDCLAKLMGSNVQGENSFACVITDVLWSFAIAVANDFKLPTIVLQTTGVSGFLGYAAYPNLLEKGYHLIQGSQSEALLTEFPPLKVKDVINVETHDPKNFVKAIAALVSNHKASSGIIWNSSQDLEQVELTKMQQQYNSIPMFPIGPLHKYFPGTSSSLRSQDQSSISWLDKQAPRSIIYVSFGSAAAINDTQFLEIAWGLANSRVPFLWVVRPGLVRGAEWLEPLPKGFLEMLEGRGHIVKWAPQLEVLAHPTVGGFWTHSGWNSTLESICEGVPMICQPYLGDQMVNARFVSDVWGVGLHLEGKFERIEIEGAIKKVMVEAEGQEMRERIMNLKEKLNLCVKQGGSSYQSLEKLIDYIRSF